MGQVDFDAMSRRRFLSGSAGLLAAAMGGGILLDACGSSPGTSTSGTTGGGGGQGGTGGTLIIAMTASELPNLDTVGAATQGGEGIRFVGLQLYDSLLRYDLTVPTGAPPIVPGLASSYSVTPDAMTWTFVLRQGVTFHDGTPWNADAAVFNIERMCDKTSPLFDTTLNGIGGFVLNNIVSAKKIDDMTISVTTAVPWSFLPDQLCLTPFGSPTAIQKLGPSGFAQAPVGTGPFQFSSVTGTSKLVMKKNPNYYRGAPKLDEVILLPTPDATARAAALQAGQVNWIEVPPPDDVPSLKKAGYQVLTKAYSHIWPWVYDLTQKPFDNVMVRQALNYGIDRQTMCSSILNDTGTPAYQYASTVDVGYTAANNIYSYDPTKAKQMLSAAGYPNGFTMSLSFPTSGSGNMDPIPMNEFLQKNLADIGVKVDLQPIEWASMLTYFDSGKIPGNANAMNISLAFFLPSAWYLFFGSQSPINIGHYNSPTVDSLLLQAEAQLDPVQRNAIFEQMQSTLLQDAPWLVVCHDLNPRALASSVKDFVMPSSWFCDLTTVSVT